MKNLNKRENNMENKINIAELLRDCPKGMELDCVIYVNPVRLEEVTIDERYPIVIKLKNNDLMTLTEYGSYDYVEDAKCIIFPKGKTTWEGFVPPCKFKDGDIVYAIDEGNEYIFILKHIFDNGRVYCYLNLKSNDLRIQEVWLTDYNATHRLATKEEKEKLFQAIKDNGYHWNEETKTLEKLVEPMFKIEKGKWYVCIKDLLDNYANKAFCKGDTYYSPEDGYLIPSNSNVPSKVEYCIDEYFRDWTIQDAKDGDVIFCDSGWTCIFKCIHGIWFSSYCFITSDGEFHTGYDEHAVDSTINGNAHLATKEQCNLLFQKIKEAGYKWNAKTKTLEKLPEFKDGDVLSTDDGKFIAIIKKNGGKYYACYHTKDIYFEIGGSGWFDRLATEEEKQELFHVIKVNGYKWNPETKTLEKLTESKEDTDDKVVMSGIYFNREDYADEVELHLGNYEIEIRGGRTYAVFKNQKTKTLEKLVKPIFRVGDTIRNKVDKWPSKRTIKSFTEGIGYFTTINDWIRINDQDNWELVPDKFDITTLVPFESRVLVRDTDHYEWEGAVFGRYDGNSFFTIGGVDWRYCIPYECNKHLFGSTKDCDDFYKIWEK